MSNKTKKSSAAVALGRLGGLKGGPALTGGIDGGMFLRSGKLPELHRDGLLKFQSCADELSHLTTIVL
jgi:hypothetical protein